MTGAMNAPRWKANDPRWEKLERVWREEGLRMGVLSKRFGVSVATIQRRLTEKYGTAVPPTNRSLL